VTARLKRPHISARRGGDVIKRYSGGLHPRPSLYLAATARREQWPRLCHTAASGRILRPVPPCEKIDSFVYGVEFRR